MKNFEMPKMNVAIFSLEDVITTSQGGATPEEVKNLDAAKAALAEAGVTEAQITVTTAQDWVDA